MTTQTATDPVLTTIKLARALGRMEGPEEAAKLYDNLYNGERGVWIGVDEVADKSALWWTHD
ncbi:MAG: hypothetical protein ABI612_06130 [Betaproteobacteria bacterium]